MTEGRFITLEGGEGVGKSTHVDFVAGFLRERGIEVVITREPGGTPMGEKIREIFLGERKIAKEAELLLMFAARCQNLEDVIEPALKSGAWVVCDRFTDASHAYQGGGRGVDEDFILCLENRLQKGRRPDLTLLFDTPPEIGLGRARLRGGNDRIEAEPLDFFGRVRETYLRLAYEQPGRIRLIDATPPLEEVRAEIAIHLQRFCGA